MELKLFYNGKIHRYLVSKFIRRFIIPLDQLQLELCEANARVGEREHRKGRVVNDVLYTGTGPGSVVLPIDAVPGAVRCLAKRIGSAGFSSFVFGTEYPVTDAGYLTLILKTGDMPKFDGFYLNAFWGKPVRCSEVWLSDTYEERKEAAEYWKTSGYSARVVPMNADTMLFAGKLTPVQQDTVERTVKKSLGYVGRADVDLTWNEIWLKPDGEFFVYRGCMR